MQASKSIAGLLSLSNVIATASSARVLDLHALAAENLDDPDYADQPLFKHPVLNRSIIVKHNVRAGEMNWLPRGRFNATKVIFPFDLEDLDLGGQLLFVGQRDFVTVLTRHLDYTDFPLDRDVEVLRILDKLPTLDPFLIREILKRHGVTDVARCYYRLSETDKAEMLGFVADEIEALIQLCFGERKGNNERMRRLSQLLLADRESAGLEPLRETFRMEPSEFSEAMFAWKAFLFYRWRSEALTRMVESTLNSLSTIRPKRYERDEWSYVIRAKLLLKRAITDAWRDVGQRLRLYDTAFTSLTVNKNPENFRAFLKRGPSLFVELGDRIGLLEQVVSFWDDRFGDQRMSVVSPDEVLDGLRELLQALSLDVSAQRPLAKSPQIVRI